MNLINEYPKTLTNDNGTAIKFADGTMICTKQITKTFDITTVDNNSYACEDDIDLGKYAETFVSEPILSVTLNSGYKAYVIRVNQTWSGLDTTSNIALVKVGRATAQSNYKCIFNIIAIGRWK